MSQPDENDGTTWTCPYCGEPHKGRGCQLEPTEPLTREQLRDLERRLREIDKYNARLRRETIVAMAAAAKAAAKK